MCISRVYKGIEYGGQNFICSKRKLLYGVIIVFIKVKKSLVLLDENYNFDHMSINKKTSGKFIPVTFHGKIIVSIYVLPFFSLSPQSKTPCTNLTQPNAPIS